MKNDFLDFAVVNLIEKLYGFCFTTSPKEKLLFPGLCGLPRRATQSWGMARWPPAIGVPGSVRLVGGRRLGPHMLPLMLPALLRRYSLSSSPDAGVGTHYTSPILAQDARHAAGTDST
jgi:hypothetical protein